jgi:hypothetical protein
MKSIFLLILQKLQYLQRFSRPVSAHCLAPIGVYQVWEVPGIAGPGVFALSGLVINSPIYRLIYDRQSISTGHNNKCSPHARILGPAPCGTSCPKPNQQLPLQPYPSQHVQWTPSSACPFQGTTTVERSHSNRDLRRAPPLLV